MPIETKRWKTEIWLKNQDQPVIIYGDSLASLKQATRIWLLENQPLAFGNTPPHYSVPKQQKRYLYSDGSQTIPAFSIHSSTEQKVLDQGWYRLEGNMLFPQAVPLENFPQVVTCFIEEDMIIETGPEYKEAIQKANQSCTMRMITHPTMLSAVIGMTTAMCYLAMPIHGGSVKNFVLVLNNLLAVILFVSIITISFLIIGYVVHNGMSALELLKSKQKQTKHQATKIESL